MTLKSNGGLFPIDLGTGVPGGGGASIELRCHLFWLSSGPGMLGKTRHGEAEVGTGWCSFCSHYHPPSSASMQYTSTSSMSSAPRWREKYWLTCFNSVKMKVAVAKWQPAIGESKGRRAVEQSLIGHWSIQEGIIKGWILASKWKGPQSMRIRWGSRR